jgi:hypothetical protein
MRLGQAGDCDLIEQWDSSSWRLALDLAMMNFSQARKQARKLLTFSQTHLYNAKHMLCWGTYIKEEARTKL